MVDCANHFRLLRLKDSDSASQISDEIKKRTGQKILIEYVNQAEQGVTSPALEKAAPVATAAPSPPVAEAKKTGAEPGAPEDERPFPPTESDGAAATPAEEPEVENDGMADQDDPHAEATAFLEAAGVSVTEVKNPSGPSLFT